MPGPPPAKSSAFCKTCHISICVLCLSEKQNAHEIGELSEKVDTLSDIIAKENEQLQSLQSDMEKILVHINRRSAELPLASKQTKNNVTSHIRGKASETLQSFKRPTDNLTQEAEDEISLFPKALYVPSVLTTLDAQFPTSKENNNRLYSIVPLGDGRVWVGGHSDILKLFYQERLIATVNKKSIGLFLTLHEGHIVYPDTDKTLKKVINGKIDTLFSTGEWIPDGITCTAARDFLVCLRSTDDSQSKVVRYSSSGDVLQEIQYDSLHQPLFKWAIYVVEDCNGDICVVDWNKNAVTVVDKFGIFRYSYTGNKASKFKPCSLTKDSMHRIITTDFLYHKIHMLDRDGRFLRYIIPDQGIQRPRAVCVIREGELMVGECITGMIKRIKYLA
ncbi:uncharacterized protein LOC134264194 [Saccostrea cucullata]|uniref:uncharacterized protein LOC134264194 n=1 Tax=Saccostrea cuccullata TaxID=36930 RepID=UPI002ED57D17